MPSVGPAQYCTADLRESQARTLDGRAKLWRGRTGLGTVARLLELGNEGGRRRVPRLSRVEPLATELLAADTMLIGAPMASFQVSASLKAWMDRVGFPSVFIVPGAGDNLLLDTKVVVVSVRCGVCDLETPREMTLTGLVTEPTRFRPFAADSLAAVRAEMAAPAARK